MPGPFFRKSSLSLQDPKIKRLMDASSSFDLNLGIFSILASINNIHRTKSIFNIKTFLNQLREYSILQNAFCEKNNSKPSVFIDDFTKSEKILLDQTKIPRQPSTRTSVEFLSDIIVEKGYPLSLHLDNSRKGSLLVQKTNAAPTSMLSKFQSNILSPQEWDSELYPSDPDLKNLITRLQITTKFYKHLHCLNLVKVYDETEKALSTKSNPPPQFCGQLYENKLNLPLLGVCGDQNNPILYVFSIFQDHSGRSFQHVDIDIGNIIKSVFSQDKQISTTLKKTKSELQLNQDDFYYGVNLLARSNKDPDILMTVSCISFSKDTNAYRTNDNHPLQQLYRSLIIEKQWEVYYAKRSYYKFQLREHHNDGQR